MRNTLFIAAGLLLGSALTLPAPSLPASDQRAGAVQNLNTPRTFPEINSRAEWEKRAEEIRRQILVSCGLWPMPEKTPLNAQIFDRVERDGYSLAKVYMETFPGVYLAGNLYRPLGEGPGPFPGILNPHGHWREGRLVDSNDGSVAARCIQFARQGMVAFAFDMIGYNDTFFPDHALEGQDYYKRHRLFASDPRLMLWSISQMGLQTWNSMRALDFLESLPDVDKSRLACTGGSGGGTQTFILGAIDDRLSVVAPAVMVSHSMQGGCSCENVCGLRIDFSNMEISAAAAPKPQILVAATGDWTRTTSTIEGPGVESIYSLFRAQDRFHHVTFDYGHNYNQTTREAVYEWFGRWLLRHPEPVSLKELAYEKLSPADLRVFPEGRLPDGALREEQFVQWLKEFWQTQIAGLQPANSSSLREYRRVMLPAWEQVLQVETPRWELLVEKAEETRHSAYTAKRLFLGRDGRGDRIPAVHLLPNRPSIRFTVILAHPDGKSVWLDESGNPTGLAKSLLEKNQGVLLLDTFLTGTLADEEATRNRNHFANFFTTYNRTDTQERVQDLITAGAYAQRFGKAPRVALVGFGRAGLWAMLASPSADAVGVDWDSLDPANEETLLAQDIFVPGLLRIGGFEGVAMLGAPRPMLLHNTGREFTPARLQQVYGDLRAAKSLRVERIRLRDEAIADWVLSL
jgi:dienelactone hydrolase